MATSDRRNARFATLAAEFATLQKQFDETTDLALQDALLVEMRLVVDEMDVLVKHQLEEPSE